MRHASFGGESSWCLGAGLLAPRLNWDRLEAEDKMADFVLGFIGEGRREKGTLLTISCWEFLNSFSCLRFWSICGSCFQGMMILGVAAISMQQTRVRDRDISLFPRPSASWASNYISFPSVLFMDSHREANGPKSWPRSGNFLGTLFGESGPPSILPSPISFGALSSPVPARSVYSLSLIYIPPVQLEEISGPEIPAAISPVEGVPRKMKFPNMRLPAPTLNLSAQSRDGESSGYIVVVSASPTED